MKGNKLTEHETDVWWNSLELRQLLRLFVCPYSQDYNDFIEDLDEWWYSMTPEDKLEFYERHYDKV